MPVPRRRDGAGQDDAGRVGGVPYPLPVDPPRDLADQDGGEPPRAELLVDAEEVDLGRGDEVSVVVVFVVVVAATVATVVAAVIVVIVVSASDVERRRNGGDESDEPSRLVVGPDPDVPLPDVSRGRQRPLQEVGRVAEPEGLLVVLDVVFF